MVFTHPNVSLSLCVCVSVIYSDKNSYKWSPCFIGWAHLWTELSVLILSKAWLSGWYHDHKLGHSLSPSSWWFWEENLETIESVFFLIFYFYAKWMWHRLADLNAQLKKKSSLDPPEYLADGTCRFILRHKNSSYSVFSLLCSGQTCIKNRRPYWAFQFGFGVGICTLTHMESCVNLGLFLVWIPALSRTLTLGRVFILPSNEQL